MIKRSHYLSERLKEVFIDGTWIANTNYQDQLRDVTREVATTKIASLNTIAALTYHINYYLEGLIKVLEGGPLNISDQYSYDVPELYEEKDWTIIKNHLITNAERFISLVHGLSDEALQMPFIRSEYGTYERNIEGVIEHSYYHLGQIVIIKKQIHHTTKS